ncbi:pantothenate kinase 2, mitochondrial [Trichuris trichiura]|uniref:Pantothenate kinase 2, mitochondrial n=1 Tax=Trichuris trichiura TaxID=36087 RepID=A0A077Z269_TRITR|nr:pantothenate kinase 2, mitochondrial [Trichuris trichiura]
MPWFGIDIGGTLVKVVYFDPTDENTDHEYDNATVRKIRHLLLSNTAYGKTGVRDVQLQLENQPINGRIGTIHFIRFPTTAMPAFINLARLKGLARSSSTVCATGGGAYLYGKACQELSLKFNKLDELHALVAGIQFILQHNPEECYYFANPLGAEWKQVTLKEQLQPPYIVVNIGSGVSILAVDDKQTLGGGTFQGLCCLLAGTESFEEALQSAARGDNLKVDKLVRDIYGGDYKAFNLSGTTVAASFGNMIHADKRALVTSDDLTSSVLVTVTHNIASLALLCARVEVRMFGPSFQFSIQNAVWGWVIILNVDILQKMKKLIFVGNFLRINTISMRHIAEALNYWSNGTCNALFMKHEGYFGAVGCLINMMTLEEAGKEP